MLKCFFTRRKLYDYLDNTLCLSDSAKVKRHLDVCPDCRKKLGGLVDLLELAKNKKSPQVPDGFWHSFKVGLDQKLNQRLIPEFNFKAASARKLNTVWAFSLASLCILVISVSLFFNLHTRPLLLTQSEAELAEEAILLDELDSAVELNHNEDAYLDELDLFDYLDQNISGLG